MYLVLGETMADVSSPTTDGACARPRFSALTTPLTNPTAVRLPVSAGVRKIVILTLLPRRYSFVKLLGTRTPVPEECERRYCVKFTLFGTSLTSTALVL